MSRKKELVKNTAIVAVGKVCTKFLSFFMLPFYTAVLSTEDYGIVDLFNTYVSLLLPIILFQIEDALFRFTIDVRNNEQEKRKIISTVICFGIFQSFVFSIIYGIVQNYLAIVYKEYLWMNVIASIFSSLLLQLARGVGDNYGYAIGSFLTAAFAIGLNMVFVLFMKLGADGLFISAILSNFVGVAYFVYRLEILKHVRLKWFHMPLLKEMLAYSLPLVPNYLSWWVVGASDKSVVSYFLGISQNGILSVSQKFSTAYTTFYSIFNLTWTEHASVHRDDKDSEQYYSYIIETAFRVLSSACIGIIAVVAVAFPYLIHERFGEAYYQIPIYMLSSFLYSVIGIYSVVYVALKKTGDIAKTSIIAAIINLAVNLLFVQHIGLYASSISSVIAYGVMLTIRYFDIKKYMHIRIKKSVICSTILFMIISFVVYYMRIMWLSMLNLLLVGAYAVYVNRSMLKDVFGAVKQKLGRV